MPTQSAQSPRPEGWLTISQISTLYKKSSSLVRQKLKNALDNQVHKGSGPSGNAYDPELIEQIFGKRPGAHLTPALRSVLENPSESSGTIVIILQSRHEDNAHYNQLLTEMIRTADELLIRCVTGTDLFNAHHPTDNAFLARGESNRETKILLMYPFGRAAETRTAAEGDIALRESQFSRDARSTWDFIRVNEGRYRLNAKWVDDGPKSFLIWSEQYAILEPYDFGRPITHLDGSGCIGRNAPILVVQGGSPYHSLLKNGFNYIFHGDDAQTHIDTYPLNKMTQRYRPDAQPEPVTVVNARRAGRSKA